MGVRIFVLGLLLLGCHKGTAILDGRDSGASGDLVSEDCVSSPEICDGVDNDCDGEVDEALLLSFFTDADADGYGDPGTEQWACTVPEGAVENADDCDDTTAAANPDSFEICDEIDNDCDGDIDEDQPTQVWYPDEDGDGFGNEGHEIVACREPAAAIQMPGDCDDSDAEVHPGMAEVCDRVDQDCDGQVDEGVTTSFFLDADGDGWGDPDEVQDACDLPDGYSESDEDCDDDAATTHPDADDVCDEVDNDCDGVVDEDGDEGCAGAPVYSEDFEEGEWGEWSNLALSSTTTPAETWGVGGAEWSFSDGLLCEASDEGNEFALGPEIGEIDGYSVSVDIQVLGDSNNGVGLVFSYAGISAVRMLLWADPLAYYEWTTPPSIVSLYERVGSSWEVVTDSGAHDATVADGVWSTLAVQVDGDEVTALLNGEALFTETTTLDSGPLQVGVWTWDNDGGVCFDNVVVSPL